MQFALTLGEAPEAVSHPSERWCDGYALWKGQVTNAALEGRSHG